MKSKTNRTYLLFIIITIVITINTSCSSEYEREDLLTRYIKKHNKEFNNESEFYLLSLRYIYPSCAADKLAYNSDSIVNYVTDSIKDKPVFIISDDDYVLLYLKKLEYNSNVYFVQESTMEMGKYGFYYKPYLFHIKNNSIKNWKKIDIRNE